MEIIILGLKHKITGAYKVFNVIRGHKRQTKLPEHKDITIGKTITIDKLAPFPFEQYSSISFDYQDEILKTWKPCYLKVNADLSKDEFESMKSSGIKYYRFDNRKITFIEEFFDIFQYTKKMIDHFKDQLGTYDATTWIIHNDINSCDELDAMKSILLQASHSKSGLDLSITKYILPYLSYLKDITTKQKSNGFSNISYGRYGSNNLLQEDINATILDLDTWFYAFENISVYHGSWLNHPIVTKEWFDDLRQNHQNYFQKLLTYLSEYNDDRFVLANRINMDDLFKEILPIYLNDWKHKIDPYFSENNSNHPLSNIDSLNQLFSMDYPLEHVIDDPYESYCCDECDGPLPDNWEDDITEYDVDPRMEFILGIINPWDKYITNHGKKALLFIPDDYFDKIINEL